MDMYYVCACRGQKSLDLPELGLGIAVSHCGWCWELSLPRSPGRAKEQILCVSEPSAAFSVFEAGSQCDLIYFNYVTLNPWPSCSTFQVLGYKCAQLHWVFCSFSPASTGAWLQIGAAGLRLASGGKLLLPQACVGIFNYC